MNTVQCTLQYLDKVLFDHVVEGGHDTVDGDGGVAHAEDPVKLGSHEGHARLRHGLSKHLVLDILAWTRQTITYGYFGTAMLN